VLHTLSPNWNLYRLLCLPAASTVSEKLFLKAGTGKWSYRVFKIKRYTLCRHININSASSICISSIRISLPEGRYQKAILQGIPENSTYSILNISSSSDKQHCIMGSQNNKIGHATTFFINIYGYMNIPVSNLWCYIYNFSLILKIPLHLQILHS
jgi:hypothetical protein